MKYDELMDKIEVTDAMRARILRNVSAAVPKKTTVRRYALLAACLAVVLLGAVCVPKLMDPAPQGEQTTIANGKLLMKDRELIGIDEEAINAHILEESKKLWGALNDCTY